MQIWFTCSSSITSSTNREDEWYDVAAQILGRENHGLRELSAHSHGKILRMYFEHAKSGSSSFDASLVQPHVAVHRKPTPALVFERVVQLYITICNYSGHKRGLWFCHCCKSPIPAILTLSTLICHDGNTAILRTKMWAWDQVTQPDSNIIMNHTPHTQSWL
jgi:hypothetical protein